MTEVAQPATVRLVATAHLRPPALAPLAGTADDLADLAELESATSGRLAAEGRGMAALAPGELVFGVPRATFINAAFAYTRPGGSRFNGEHRGAWYCALACETALAEVAFHLTRALGAVGRYDNASDYAELLADFIGSFHDLRAVPDAPCLDPDPAAGYPAGQAMARAVLAAGGSGILYPSVRQPGGTCLAALRPHIVQNVRSGDTWRLVWSGTPVPTVSRLS